MKLRLNFQVTSLFAAVLFWHFANGTAVAQPPFAVEYRGHLTVRNDRTGTEISTKRIKILTPSAIQTLSQQQLPFVEGMQTLETVEAYTEKSDGRHIPVDPANIITRDAATGLQASYAPDLKQRTIIFPDVSVGDTLVMTNRTNILSNEFTGYFTYIDLFSRSQSLASVQLTIEAPSALDLAVSAKGNATTHTIESSNEVRRHTISVIPETYSAEEPGAVSPLDRDPAVFVSTFRSYEELGLVYGKTALPKAEVTPEIASLANEITNNISDRRAQAVAIDAWVKKNIRYVAVFLSVGRVVPHEAAAILQNKFGDCKDKATLMASLLAAKGIASEAALINLGNAYSLPEPPTLAALNHVILYLPEFDVYDDPTANVAAFGVLAPETYDKPVVRVAATGVKLARTPAMMPGDHTAHATTTVKIAADGTITGQTQESNTGILGLALRYVGGILQQVGDGTVAQRQLQGFNTPGTGRFELGNSSETLDPATINGSFTLNDRFKTPAPGGIASIPVGMPLTLRPGNFLLGARLSGRKSAFVCFAGTQTEDIEVTFDPTLPLPSPLPPSSIDNPFFSYRSTFKVEDRKLKIHREFVSRVPKQLCPPETEPQITADLVKVRTDVNSAYRFPAAVLPAPTPPPPSVINVVATAGQRRQIALFFSLNLDCSSMGLATVTTVEAAQHGTVTVGRGMGMPNFPQNSTRFECNKGQAEGTSIVYEPNPGFTGNDSLSVDIVYADKSSAKRRYSINVNPRREAAAPPNPPPVPPPSSASPNPRPIVDVTRVAVADQMLRVAFLYYLNPDCSGIGVPAVRIMEQPKSGKVSVENGNGFPAFPANNSRYKCNDNRTEGTVISYNPNSGYTGPDSVIVEIIYPDGNAIKRRYVIDVR